jgi:hypothetical protein
VGQNSAVPAASAHRDLPLPQPMINAMLSKNVGRRQRECDQSFPGRVTLQVLT